MTVFRHEMKQGSPVLIVWTLAISFLLGVSILIYPQMATQVDEISKMFSDMGSFTEAFGMNRVNFGEFSGYFAVECGNVLGLGGAFYAALLGAGILAKEEEKHTAEFLLTHPVSRVRILAEKLLSLIARAFLLTLGVAAVSLLCSVLIGEKMPADLFALLFLAYFLQQCVLACVTFGVSAFLRRGSAGVGIALAAVTYFLSILANLVEETEFLKYLTSFSFADGTVIAADHAIPVKYLLAGIGFAAAGVLAAFLNYPRKDIA